MKPLLTLSHLTKTYLTRGGPVQALRGITATINEHTITCLVGVNGAGKTTLSSLIASLHPPTSGDIKLGDTSIYDDIVAYRTQLGYVPQHLYLDDAHTVHELLCNTGVLYGMSSQQSRARADELIQQLSLGEYRDRLPHHLSGGYRQKLGIARALVHKPRLIILDEPTVGLDPHARRQVLRALAALRTNGTTVLLTTHYLDEVEELADEVLMIDHGTIVQQGTPAALMAAAGADTLEQVFLQLIESTRS